MCGIIAYTGRSEAVPILLGGLKSLEYRGYDSAGLAVVNGDARVAIARTPGRVEILADLLASRSMTGAAGIAHTRWATHGAVNEANCHPHSSADGSLAIVHNGIVENYVGLRNELTRHGYAFRSETDSEVIAHLVDHGMKAGDCLEDALRKAARKIRGAAAVVATSALEPEKIVGLRLGNAGGIVVGLGEEGSLLASDLLAILPHTNRVVYLDSGEMAVVTPKGASFLNLEGMTIEKSPVVTERTYEAAAIGNFPHFMLKEIHEQAEAVTNAMRSRVDFESRAVSMPEFPLSPDEVSHLRQVVLVGMGSSLYAAMMGAHAVEALARVPCHVENASEFRYRAPVLDRRTLVIAVTQSGETADTLAAMEAAAQAGARLLWVGEAEGSQADRMAEASLLIRAGQEIGVAATKTMMNTAMVLHLLALHLAKMRDQLPVELEGEAAIELAALPGKVGELLDTSEQMKTLAARLAVKQHLLYLGRGEMLPPALEGALKMKEIAYIHAEGYPAGEMKHGVNALIGSEMPTIALAPAGALREKMVGNVNEVKARGGEVIALVTEGDDFIPSIVDESVVLPKASESMAPFLALVPLQLLAYHTAVLLGHDPDKPRNLAKTVTVE